VFPLFHDGKIKGFSCRSILDGVEPRYKTISHGFIPPWNSSAIKYCTKELFINEGCIDALSMDSAGFCAVGVIGGQNFNSEHAALFKGFKHEITILMDNDENGSGDKIRRRMAKTLIKNGLLAINFASLPRADGEKKVDLNSLRCKMSQEEFAKMIRDLPRIPVDIVNVLKQDLKSTHHHGSPMHTNTNKIEELVNLVELASEYIEILPGNKAVCPFHGDTDPSL